MLPVLLTVDCEVWCDDWAHLDEQFPGAWRRYVYGPTARGEHGLPLQLKMLADHGLKACFFVEPLFAMRFGRQWLAEEVGLIRAAGQEVQLHLHTEWADETRPPLVAGMTGKRQYLRDFSRAEQTELIGLGKRLLIEAGVPEVTAFRAGSFGFNADTLPALAANGIAYDSSYNATMFGPDSGVRPGELLLAPTTVDSVCEVPLSVYRDGLGRLRHLQIGATSWGEMERLLWQAAEAEWPAFVILFHNFELMNQRKDSPDPVVLDRFRRFCAFMDKHRDVFCTRGFEGTPLALRGSQPAMLKSSFSRTAVRVAEQLARRRYG